MKQKWQRRDKKLDKRKRGMIVTGRSVFTIQEIKKMKAEKAKAKKPSRPKGKS